MPLTLRFSKDGKRNLKIITVRKCCSIVGVKTFESKKAFSMMGGGRLVRIRILILSRNFKIFLENKNDKTYIYIYIRIKTN